MTDQYSPGAAFSLADLAPPPLTFYDSAFGGDGARHVVRTHDHLGPEHIGEMLRLEADLRQCYGELAAVNGEDREALAVVGRRLVAVVDATIALLIPTLPAARVAAIPFRAKERLLTWWGESQAARPPARESLDPLGKAAGRATAPRRRSRGSSPPTG